MHADLIERLAREAQIKFCLKSGGSFEEELIRLVAEECAKVCDEKERQKWLTIRDGGTLSGIGPKDCGDAIRAKFGEWKD